MSKAFNQCRLHSVFKVRISCETYFDQDNCWVKKWVFEIVTLVGNYSELIFERMENCQFRKSSFAL